MPPPPRLKIQVETLRARGLTVSEIAAKLGMNLEYARKLTHERYDLVSLYDPFHIEQAQDEAYADRCLAEGGFPAAVTLDGKTAWIDLNGCNWRHLKRRRRAA